MKRAKAMGTASIVTAVVALLLFRLPGCTLVSKPDTVSFFQIDPNQPFRVEFGRGSGWHDLDAIALDQTGRVVLRRQPQRAGETWTTAELQLSGTLTAEIISRINAEKLTGLDRTYSTTNVVDGSQWVFFIAQGTKQKVIYFDNNFPATIKRFATSLDDVLKRGGIDALTWKEGGEDLQSSLWQHERTAK